MLFHDLSAGATTLRGRRRERQAPESGPDLCAASEACEKEAMADHTGHLRKRGAVRLSDLVGKALEPAIARRGFATADLLANWPAIAGSALAEFTAPEKILWPRDTSEEFAPGVLVLKVDGPKAIYVQHETAEIVERLNAFFGYAAIGQLRIIQGPVGKRLPKAPKRDGQPIDEPALAAAVAPVESDALRAALERLGRQVLANPLKQA